jgi:hypothetical protein
MMGSPHPGGCPGQGNGDDSCVDIFEGKIMENHPLNISSGFWIHVNSIKG